MADRIFLDSNVLIYSYSSTELHKQMTARSLMLQYRSFISTQVLQELTNILTKKFGFAYSNAVKVIEESCNNNQIHTNRIETILEACQLAH